MFSKSFVSIVFYQNKLQVVKLDAKRKKVTKFAQYEIPPGIIMKYRVRDQAALTKIIAQVWKKTGLRDKFVGVVVPEFSTYTKTLSLPSLANDEINEAIQWQLQDFLPTTPNNVISDWKIIKRSAETTEVLVVSILRDILFGYVDAVGHAGLFPLVVETPSLSLERITGEDQKGKIILYVGQGESLIILSEGGKIIASSVVSSNKVDDTVNTATRMIEHYRDCKVEHIHVGGVGVSQDLIQYLNYNLGIPVQLIKYPIKGLSPGQIQDYLTGISMQLTDPAEPESELTVNLLPPGWATHYKNKLRDIRYWTLTLMASVGVWSAFLSTVVVVMLIGVQSEQLAREHAADGGDEYDQVIAQIEEINQLSEKTIEVTNGLIPPQEILNQIASVQPSGVTISLYDINLESARITVSGTATSPEEMIAFANGLEENKDFGEVKLPFPSLDDQDTSFDFQFTFDYLPSKKVTKQAPRLSL